MSTKKNAGSHAAKAVRGVRHAARMPASDRDATYNEALGRLPDVVKREFLDQALYTLDWMRAAEAKRVLHWKPSRAHYNALEDLAEKARALVLALYRTTDLGIPDAYLREAWAIVAQAEGISGAPFPHDIPRTLRLLAVAARLWRPDPKPKHRPVEHSSSTFLITLLAENFLSASGKPPTFGTNSPFVKFCNFALPDYGFDALSIQKMKSAARPNPRVGKSRRKFTLVS